MKSMLTLSCIFAAISFILFGCTSSAASEVSVKASCDDFTTNRNISEQMEIAVGGSLTVTLCSNPSTGFRWSEARIIDQTILKQIEHKFVAPEGGGATSTLGAAGNEIWNFKAQNEGTSSVFMEYGQPWEGGEKGVWRFNLTVVVK